jgi:Ca-activated chloride channel family protein
VRGEAPQGALVLLTDGDALEERAEVLRAADVARRMGVPVSAIGLGTAQGGPVPDVDPVSGRQLGFKREPTGEVAVSRLGGALLAEVAKHTGGVYLPATNPDAAARAAAAVRRVPPRAKRAGAGATPANRYEWFAAAALLLLALDALLPEHRRRRPKEVAG